MNANFIETQRIRLVCDFLSNKQGNLKQMLRYVNEKLVEQDLHPVSERTLQACLEKLRKGDFDHSLRAKPPKIRGNLFKVVFQNKIYKWDESTRFPEFGDLDPEERFTLPFLAGLLNKFNSIPAVEKILHQLPEVFNITEKEMKSHAALFVAGPLLVDENDLAFESKVIQCVIKILGHIYQQEYIHFHYLPVNYTEEQFKQQGEYKVAPLQIRFYEHYYYLVAQDYESGNISIIRVDQIFRLRVDALENDKDKVMTFKRVNLLKKLDLDKHFRHSLGTWSHFPTDILCEVRVEFLNWAASYAKRLKFHHSQETISYDKISNRLVISLRLMMTPPPNRAPLDIECNKELAFLLGRFRSSCRILSIERV